MGVPGNQSEITGFLTYFSFLLNLCFIFFYWKLKKMVFFSFSKGSQSAWPYHPMIGLCFQVITQRISSGAHAQSSTGLISGVVTAGSVFSPLVVHNPQALSNSFFFFEAESLFSFSIIQTADFNLIYKFVALIEVIYGEK